MLTNPCCFGQPATVPPPMGKVPVRILPAILGLLAAVVVSADDTLTTTIDSIEEQTRALWLGGSYAEAAGAAREFLSLRRADEDSKPHEIVDAEWLVRTLETARVFPGHCARALAQADSLRGVIDVAWETGDYGKGRAAAEQRLELTRRCLGSQHPYVAHSLDELGGFLDELGESAEGERLCCKALAMRESLLVHEHPDVALNLTNLSVFAFHRGDYREALELTQESTRLYRGIAGGDDLDLAASITNEALYLQYLGDYDAAGELFREGLAMQERILGAEDPEMATGIDNLACLYRDTGEYAKAEVLQRKALEMRRRAFGDDNAYVAISLSNLGLSLMDQGDYAGAERVLLESVEIHERLFGPGHSRLGTVLNNQSQLYFEWGQYEQAEKLQREAAEVARAVGVDHPHLALCIDNLASALFALGRYDEAEPLFREALEMRRRLLGDTHFDTASTLHNLGTVLRMQGRHDSAEPALLEAQRIFDKILGRNHRLRCMNLFQLAQIRRARGDIVGAEELFTEAAGIFEAARLGTKAGLNRAWFTGSPHEALAATRCELSMGRQAWEAVERARARSLADMLLVAEERELTPAEVAREDSLKRLIIDLEREFAAYWAASEEDPGGEVEERASAAGKRLLAAEREWAEFQAQMAERYPASEGAVFALERVQATLAERTAIIGWVDLETRRGDYSSWGYVVRSDGPVCWARVGVRGEADGDQANHVRSFRASLTDPQSPRMSTSVEGRDVWADRIKPLVPALDGVDDLVVVPTGLMVGIPIEAVIDSGGAGLCERFTVTYAPSATVHTWLAESASAATHESSRRALLVGDPFFSELQFAERSSAGEERAVIATGTTRADPSLLRRAIDGDAEAVSLLPRLPGARHEIDGVASVHGAATVLSGLDASEERLDALASTGELAAFGLIHFATHAIVDVQRPERSALVLSQVGLPDPVEAAMSGQRIYDGFLTAKEMLHEWRLDADLVTLSACDTAVGTEVGGEGHIGFAHVLLQAGTRSLLLSLWKVDDAASSLLMRRFYEDWLGEYEDERGGLVGERMTKARALREAKHWLRNSADESGGRPYEHPYFWAAFILIGDRS